MSQDWDIKPRSRVCQKCETPFADRQPCFTRLLFTAEGYQRMDCCETCVKGAPSTDPVVSSWKSIFRVPPPEPERTVKKETAESLLRSLVAAGDPSRRHAIYILAVMLERQRILVEKEVRRSDDGSPIRVYEHRKNGDVFLIADPQLRLDQLDRVQKEVSAMLAPPPDGGPAPAAAPSAAGAAPADAGS